MDRFETLDGKFSIKQSLPKGKMCENCHKRLASGFFAKSRFEFIAVCPGCGKKLSKLTKKYDLARDFIPLELLKKG